MAKLLIGLLSKRAIQPILRKSADFHRINLINTDFPPPCTMGTGIVSILLITIPFKSRWLYWNSVIFFVLNTLLFSAAFFTSVLRYTLYPEIWSVMIADGTNSLFLGTIPMGFATLVECRIFLCIPY